MPRLIDKDELKKAIQENICQVICDEPRGCSYCRVDDVWDVIHEQPTVDIDAITASHEQIGFDKGYREGYAQATVDAVPVVRCKDCRKWCICHKSDDYYCADGERREDV